MSAWQPVSGASVAARRFELLERVRKFFAAQDVLAVDTQTLSAAAATDAQIESFTVDCDGGKAYLHTSPEACMKRLLAAGYPDIYSVCRVYRDGERGMSHLPEFTLIEWYRRGFSLQQIIQNTIALIVAVLGRDTLPDSTETWNYADLFQAHLRIDPIEGDIDALADAAGADADLRSALGEHRDTWLDLLLANKIAPTFSNSRLTVVQHYPASQAALARLCPADDAVADRFEIFCGQLELANGYVELTDAAIQAQRFEDDSKKRAALGLRSVTVDELLLAALQAGLPECAGVALGFERLHMLDARTENILDVVTFA